MLTVPNEYHRYFYSNGPKEGPLTLDPGWFRLWAPEEIERLNLGYAIPERIPGFVGFGSSGGCEIFAFDKQHRVVVLLLVGPPAESATLVAESWAEFVQLIEASSHRVDSERQ